MAKLVLEFSSGRQPELLSVSFQHPLLSGERRSIRGKTLGARNGEGTFQWTSAVQALVVLLLRSAEAGCSPAAGHGQTFPVLEGGRSTPAAALDYALSKQPAWVFDLFGADKRGRPLARRLVRRSNPERKRPGPVVLSLNAQFLSPRDISVIAGRVPVQNPDLLLHIADTVANGWTKRYARARRCLPSFGLELVDPKAPAGECESAEQHISVSPELLVRVLKREVSQTLLLSDASCPMWLPGAVKTAGCGADVRKLLEAKDAGKTLPRPSPAVRDDCITPHELLRYLRDGEPINCAVPWINAGALALFHYLEYFKRYNIRVSYDYFYSIALKRELLRGSMPILPDACVLGIGPAATMLSSGTKTGYRAHMFLPCNSHRIVMPQTACVTRLDNAEYTMLCDEPSTSLFYFEELLRRRAIDKKRILLSHTPPEEVPALLKEQHADLRAVMFFPHYALNEMFNRCRLVETPQCNIDKQETVLFLHESFCANARRTACLDFALRRAWADLSNNAALLDAVLAHMTADEKFVQFAGEISGLQAMAEAA